MGIVPGDEKMSKKTRKTIAMRNCVILVKGRILKYRVRRHPQARHRKVTISRDQGVVVTLPTRGSMDGMDEFFRKWEDWIEEKVEDDGVWNGPVIPQFASGSIIMLRGVPHKLEISALPAGRKRSRIRAEDGVLKMELPLEEVMEPLPPLKRFLRKEAKEVFLERVEHWSQITGLISSRVIVGERTSRWGSCSSRGTLSFCYRLIMAPPQVLDAIVVHELCHLRHQNHGKAFWALVESFFPGYKEVREWLRENSQELVL